MATKQRIGGLIIGKGICSIIRHRGMLNRMAKAGHFTIPSDNHPYVDEGDNPRCFTFNKVNYEIRYFDGCFYPFVVRLND